MPTRFAELWVALAEPFTRDEIRHRPQGGRQIPYVTARAIMNRLDEVLGPAAWWDEYQPGEHSVLCRLTVRLPDGSTVTKCDAGGYAGMPDQGDDDKSGFSDSFKRAAVKFGVGRHLYGEGVPRFERAEEEAEAPAAEAPPRTGEPLEDYRAWLRHYAETVNREWLKLIGEIGGNVKTTGELVRVYQLGGHMLKWLKGRQFLVAADDLKPLERDQLVAPLWADAAIGQEIEAEARSYCRRLWRESRDKLQPREPGSDG